MFKSSFVELQKIPNNLQNYCEKLYNSVKYISRHYYKEEENMEEKNEIKVRLSTVVYLFIILVLVFALVVVYYLGFVQNKAGDTNNIAENILTNNSLDSKYSQITETLENEEIFLLTDTIKNDNGTYTLKGKIITEDTSREPIAEYPYYKETGEYRQITLSADTKCEYSLDSYEYGTGTVGNVFSKELYFAGGQGACFNFIFEDGKCTSVVEIVTGH